MSNCYNEGFNLALGSYKLAVKAIKDKETMNTFNFNDAYSLLMKKCNFIDSVEGMFIVNWVINYIDASPDLYESIKGIRWGLRFLEMSSIISDIAEVVTSMQTLYYHGDAYNGGILLGKAVKIGTQLYMEGWFE